jgi:hypothetical protein
MFGFGGGPWVVPGDYTVKLEVGGRAIEQPLTVKMDPRVDASQEDLQKQLDMAQQVLAKNAEVEVAMRQAASVDQKLKALAPQTASHRSLAQSVSALDKQIEAIMGAEAGNPLAPSTGATVTDRTTLRYVSGELTQLERVIESDDVAPSADASTALSQHAQIADSALAKWQAIVSTNLPALNEQLRRAHLEPIEIAAPHSGESRN